MKSSLLLIIAGVANAKTAAAAPDPSIVDELKDCVLDVVNALLGGASDVVGYLLGLPRFSADLAVWAIEFVRGLPALGKAVFDGDAATLDSLAGFCVSVATTCFVVYAASAALNFGLKTLCTVKDYFSSYMVLPKMKKIGGVDVPKPLTDVRDTVQKEVLDRIINWDVKFVLPMAGESGNPSVSGLVSTTAAAASLCMMLSCAPAILAIMRGGPSKASAETLAWTMGAPPPDARHAPPAARRLASPAHPSRPLRDRARARRHGPGHPVPRREGLDGARRPGRARGSSEPLNEGRASAALQAASSPHPLHPT